LTTAKKSPARSLNPALSVSPTAQLIVDFRLAQVDLDRPAWASLVPRTRKSRRGHRRARRSPHRRPALQEAEAELRVCVLLFGSIGSTSDRYCEGAARQTSSPLKPVPVIAWCLTPDTDDAEKLRG
jgi:hypothetical protein